MNSKYKNKIKTVIIIPTGKTVDLADFINMVLDYEEKPKSEELNSKQTPPPKLE